MARTLTVTVFLLVIGAVALAIRAGEPPTKVVDLRSLDVQPLPQGQVSELFDRIRRDDPVEPALLHTALIGPQTALRADAAAKLCEWGDATSIPHLIHALTDESSHVGGDYSDPGMATTRYWTARSLRAMTGREFGYRWDDPLEKRTAAVTRWATWYLTLLGSRSERG